MKDKEILQTIEYENMNGNIVPLWKSLVSFNLHEVVLKAMKKARLDEVSKHE